MTVGDLIRFIESCEVLSMTPAAAAAPAQIPLWPCSHVAAGEIGVILRSEHYEDLGGLCEILIGDSIFLDVPCRKIEKLFAPTAE